MRTNNTLRRLLLLIVLVAGVVGKMSGQTADYQPKMLFVGGQTNTKVMSSFQKRFAEMDTIIAHAVMVDPSAFGSTSVWEREKRVNALLDSLYDAKSRHESYAFMSRSGLELTGQTYGRLDNILDLRDDDEMDDISVYWGKIQTELGWNIFNSRFYKRDATLRKIILDNEIERLRSTKGNYKELLDQVAHQLTERYNYYLAVVQYHRLINIDLLNEAYQFMLEKDRISNDKILDVLNDKMQMEYELTQTFDMESLGKEPLYRLRPTVIAVDTTALYVEMLNQNNDIRESDLKEEALKNQLSLTTYASTMRVSPFARWSGYLTSKWGYSHNVDLGVRFTFPLYNEAPKKRKGIDTEIEILRASRETMTEENKAYCRMRLTRIDRLNKAIRTEHFHITQLANYVEMRKNAYKNSKNGYNYIARMEEYNEYLKSMERMYKLMMQRSMTLIEIQKATGVVNANGIFTETLINN